MKYSQKEKRVLELIDIEAADKVTLKRIREMTFVNAKEILGIIYSSKSGNTRLKWRQTRKKIGKVQGDASSNALVNMVESGVLTQEWVDNYLRASHSRKTTQDIDQTLQSARRGTGCPSFIIVNLSNLAYFTFVFNSFSNFQ